MDRYRDRRSPDRDRARYPPTADSYVPGASRSARPRSRSPGRYRPRSRSPPRAQTDSWRGRPRSPPRRYDGRSDAYPPRNTRPRSPWRDFPPPDTRYDEASRQRSSPPAMKRARDVSSPGRGRSPLPAKRERIASPPRDHARPRSPPRRAYPSPPSATRAEHLPRARTPPRRDDRLDFAPQTWRRRSPSPRIVRPEQRSGDVSGRDSVTTSRRSSPRPYARKAEPYGADDIRAPPASYQAPQPRSPVRARSPIPQIHSPPLRNRTPPRDDVDVYDSRAARDTRPPPTGPGYRDGRAPPTGPAGSSRQGPPLSAMSPPLGPAATPVSMSAHNRPGSAVLPSYPRGGAYRGRGGAATSRDFPPRDYPPPSRGGRGSWGAAPSPYGRGGGIPPREPFSPRDVYQNESRGAPPSRHREPFGGGVGSDYGPPAAGFHGTNSTSTTYPRTQRFNNTSHHLNDLPTIKAGGERLPPLHDTSKADRLEEEAARLRKMIDDKQAKKREGLKEWEKSERESGTARLRTELADEHLRGLSGEGGEGGMAAAF